MEEAAEGAGGRGAGEGKGKAKGPGGGRSPSISCCYSGSFFRQRNQSRHS